MGEWGAARRQGRGGGNSATMAALLLRRRITDALYPPLLVSSTGFDCFAPNVLRTGELFKQLNLIKHGHEARSLSLSHTHNLFSSLPFRSRLWLFPLRSGFGLLPDLTHAHYSLAAIPHSHLASGWRTE